jgi:hypothetical protein
MAGSRRFRKALKAAALTKCHGNSGASRNAEIALLVAQHEAHVGAAAVLRHVGRLRGRDLVADLPQYDPADHFRQVRDAGMVPWTGLAVGVDGIALPPPRTRPIPENPQSKPGAVEPPADAPLATTLPMPSTTDAQPPPTRARWHAPGRLGDNLLDGWFRLGVRLQAPNGPRCPALMGFLPTAPTSVAQVSRRRAVADSLGPPQRDFGDWSGRVDRRQGALAMPAPASLPPKRAFKPIFASAAPTGAAQERPR